MDSAQMYDVQSGRLHLRHDVPRSSKPAVSALVDIDLLLETIVSTDTSVGEWINVTGYVTRIEPPATAEGGGVQRSTGRPEKGKTGPLPSTVVHVQAVMLWSAGAVRVREYETTLQDRKDMERRLAVR